MKDYKRIRKGLEEVVRAASVHISMRDRGTWLGDAVTVAEAILADTPEESEMERLRQDIAENRQSLIDANAGCTFTGWDDGFLRGSLSGRQWVLDHIQSEFLGGEDATE